METEFSGKENGDKVQILNIYDEESVQRINRINWPRLIMQRTKRKHILPRKFCTDDSWFTDTCRHHLRDWSNPDQKGGFEIF